MNKTFRHIGYGILFLTCIHFTLLAQASVTEDNAIVKKIVLSSTSGIPGSLDEKIRQTCVIRENHTFSPEAIQKSIKLLYLLGHFQDIKTFTRMEPDGVYLKFDFVFKTKIHSLKIKGGYDRGIRAFIIPGKIKKFDVYDRLLLEQQGDFSNEQLNKSIETLVDYYKKEGYFKCSITPRILDVPPHHVDITLDIDRGPQTKIRKIHFNGILNMDEATLLDKIKSRPGKKYSENRFKKDADRLRKYYNLQGFMLAKILPGEYRYDSESNTVDLHFQIQSKQKYKIEAHYKTHITWNLTWKIKEKLNRLFLWRWGKPGFELIPIWEEQYSDQRVISKGIKALKEVYRNHGYPFVEVDVSPPVIDRKTNSTLLVVTIKEHGNYKLGKITFKGNKKMKTESLRDVISNKKTVTKKVVGVVFGSVLNFVESRVEDDRGTLEAYYQTRGFLSANIKYELAYNTKKQNVDIVYSVDEGIQTMVKDISVSGVRCPSIRDKQIVGFYNKPVGKPFNPSSIKPAEQQVLLLYDTYGYTNTSIITETVFSEDNAYVDLVVDITEKLPQKVGKIILIGNKKSKDKIIHRELSMVENDWLSYQQKQRDQKKLFDLGLFREVDYQAVDVASEGQTQNLLLKIRDRKSQWFDFGVGMTQEDRDIESQTSMQVFAKYGNRNIGGYGRQFALSTTLDFEDFPNFGSNIKRRYNISFTEPWLGNLPYSLQVKLVKDSSTYERKYQLDSENLFLVFSKSISRYNLDIHLLGFHYDDTTLYNIESFERELNNPQDYAIRTIDLQRSLRYTNHSLTFGLSQDRRNHIFYPSSGHFLNLGFEVSSKTIGSKTDFSRFYLQSSYYQQVSGIVIAASIRMGIANELPYYKRFFLGGSNTVRGYRYESIGPRSYTDVPVGGSIMNNYNVELRFPVAGPFYGAAFCDAGNVWDEFSNWDPGKLYYGAGLGLRIRSPVGSIRFDAGYPLNPAEIMDSNNIRFYFSIGEAF